MDIYNISLLLKACRETGDSRELHIATRVIYLAPITYLNPFFIPEFNMEKQ